MENGNIIQRVVKVNLPKDGSKKRNRYHHGFIAQDIQLLINETNVDFGSFQDHSINGGEDQLSLGYCELIGPVVKAIQELHDKVKQLQTRIEALESA